MVDIRTGPGRTFAASPFAASPFTASRVGRGSWDVTRSHGGRSPPSRAPASARKGDAEHAGKRGSGTVSERSE